MAINPHRKGGSDVPITDGGTDASDATTAVSNLGALDAVAHSLINHQLGVDGIPGPLQIEIHELTWTNSTTPQSTSSFGFTPTAAIVIGALQSQTQVGAGTVSIGFTTGTGISSSPTNRQVGVATNADNNGTDNDDLVAYDVNDVIASLENDRSVGSLATNFTQQTGSPTRVRVTSFGAGGITLGPVGGNVTGKAFLLVFGQTIT